jgi:hypothetical protein
MWGGLALLTLAPGEALARGWPALRPAGAARLWAAAPRCAIAFAIIGLS